jgi:hypothetical protein
MSRRSGVVLLAVAIGLAAVVAVGTVGAAADDVALTVKVVDRTGEPISGADITASYEGGSTTGRTSSNGQDFLDVPEGANVTIEIDHPAYVRNEPYVVRNATEREVTVEVAPRASVVVRAETEEGDAVENAFVTVRRGGSIVASGRTDAEGRFASGPVEQDDYRVTVRREGYFAEERVVEVVGKSEARFPLERGSVTLTFRVTDDHFDPPRPVEGGSLEIGEFATVRTLGNGETTVQVPVNAGFRVTAQKENYETVTEQVRIRESNAEIRLNVSRSPVVTLSADNDRIVAGETVGLSVRDEYGDPIEGATVRLDGDPVGETDAEGRIRVRINETGDHELVAVANGVESTPVSVRAIREPTPTEDPEPTPTAEPTPTEDRKSTPPEAVPGFGPVAAALALLAFLFVARARRS